MAVFIHCDFGMVSIIVSHDDGTGDAVWRAILPTKLA